MKYMKMTLPAGKYFFGDVLGGEGAVGVPAIAAVWYSVCGNYEIEIAGGGACCYDENEVGMIGLMPIPEADAYEYGDDVTFEMSEPFEVELTESLFRAGPVTVAVLDGNTFMSPGEY
jgi:hypothetical protein